MRFLAAVATFYFSALISAQEAVEGAVPRTDTELHYTVHGQKGPIVIVLSGGPGGSVRLLQPIANHLKDRFRVVMLEQRGTDRSKLKRYDDTTINFDAYIGDIEALRVHLRQEKIIVIGSSWGMTLGFAYAGAHPDRVLALATLGSGALRHSDRLGWDEEFKKRLTISMKKRLDDLSDRNPNPDEGYAEWFKIVAPAYFYKQDEASRFAAQIKVGDLNGLIPAPAARMYRRLEEYVFDRLPRITCPVLFLQGKQDLAPLSTAEVVRQRVRTARIVLLDECGHVPWLDQPKMTWGALDEFLKPIEGR